MYQKKIAKIINTIGYRQVLIKCDQEPAIKAVLAEAKKLFNQEAMIEHAPKEAHERSNGEAEVTVQQVHGLARTLKEQVQDRAACVISAKHPVLTWLIEYAGTMITAFGRGTDGFTPYHRLKGKP